MIKLLLNLQYYYLQVKYNTFHGFRFGTIRRAMNEGYLLLKGLRKVTGEFGFSVTAYNMKRAISIYGNRSVIQSL